MIRRLICLFRGHHFPKLTQYTGMNAWSRYCSRCGGDMWTLWGGWRDMDKAMREAKN